MARLTSSSGSGDATQNGLVHSLLHGNNNFGSSDEFACKEPLVLNGHGSSPVQITFGSQDFKGAPVRWKNSKSFNPSTQRKLEVRTTGSLHCWRVESIDHGQFTINGMDVEYSINGLR